MNNSATRPYNARTGCEGAGRSRGLRTRSETAVLGRRLLAALAVIGGTVSAAATGSGALSGSDQATAYQGDASHDGAQADILTPPLTKAWSAALGGPISYPVIAQGMAYVTVDSNPSVYGTTLDALDLATGAVRWSAALGGTYFWSGLAYDGARVFSVNYDGQLRAFDATSGSALWTTQLPGQYAFSSPPTAAGGYVYTGGAGSGGTVYAVDESTGALAWTAPVMNGDDSSPVVTSSGVFVSYACQQAYDFDPATGALLWHHTSSCEGGGGRTPALADGKLYVRDPVLGNVELDPLTGSQVGTFAAGPVPAFSGSTGYFLAAGTLAAQDQTTGVTAWRFSGDGGLVSAPVVANGVVYEGSSSGMLYALSSQSGAVLWSGNVGGAIAGPDEQNVSQPLTGLAIGQGVLLVPASGTLVAYQSTPDFSLRAQPAQLRIQKNRSGSATVTATANAFFSGSVALSVAGAPSGVRTSLSPASVTLSPSGSASSTLTVAAGHSSTSFTLTVTGCRAGTCHSVPVSVTVS